MVAPGYKETEVGVLPEDWQVKPLGDVLLKGRLGGNYPNQEIESQYPLMKMGNLSRGSMDMEKVEYISSGVTPDQQHKLSKGDVLFNTRNTLDLVGKVAIWRDELPRAYYNSNLMRLEFDSLQVSSHEYANATLNTQQSIARLRAVATGTTSVAAIYTRDLLRLPFVRPPLDEQRTIAAALSDVDELIESLEKLIAKKCAMKTGTMQQLLTPPGQPGHKRLPGFSGEWRFRQFGEVTAHCSSGATPYRGRPEYYKGSVKWVSSGELNYNMIDDTLEHISEEAVKDTNLKMHPAGTFLMAITGLEAEGTRGACGVLGAPATTNQSCMAIYPTTELLTEYLYHYYVLRGKDLALKYCQGTKQQSYTARLVKLLPIDLPPSIEEQAAISTILSDMDAAIEALEARLEKTRSLKQGMMQELLTGRTRLV